VLGLDAFIDRERGDEVGDVTGPGRFELGHG
jgi:hypothetical protein